MRAYRPHIVHSRNWGAIEAVAAAKLAGVPIIIHSEHGYEIEMLDGLPLRRRLLRRLLYGVADAVFTVTKDLRNFHAHETWTKAEKIRVVYNGVDTQRFCPDLAARHRWRAKLGLGNSITVGSVGRMVPIKDYGTLLEAAIAVLEKGVDLRVILVGDGPELPRLQQRAQSSSLLANSVSFAGACDAVPELLNAMDVFALPSLHEGMSNTLLEAMATGLPVLATRAGGNPEVMSDGIHGWLFAPRNVPELADRIYQLATDNAMLMQFGRAARQHVVEQFGLESMLRRYQSLYLELAAQSRLTN